MTRGGLMRNPNDPCSLPGCKGILMIAKRELPRPTYAEGSVMRPAEPSKPVFVLDHLFCVQCGIVYQAYGTGRDINLLRATDWTRYGCDITISEVPKACQHCGSANIKTEVITNVGTKRNAIHIYGAWCDACNSVLGLLPQGYAPQPK